jgi:hypothetical protein
MMAPLTDDYQPPDKRLYYVIGRCDALQAPAIFLDWDDCSFYVDQNENDCHVEVQSFDQIMDAVSYLTDQLTKRTNSKLNPSDVFAAADNARKQSPFSSAVGNSRAAMTPSKRAAGIDTLLASSPNSKRPRPEPATVLISTTPAVIPSDMTTPFGRKFAMLQDYRQVYGTLEVKTRHCLNDRFKGLNDFLFAWRKKQKIYLDDPSLVNLKAQEGLQQLLDLGVDFFAKSTEPATDLVSTKPAPRISVIVSDKTPFGRKFAMLQDYQRVYGTLEVKARHCLVDRFRGLNDFMFAWRKKQKLFQDDPSLMNFKAQEGIQQLKDLGVEFSAKSTELATVLASTTPAPRVSIIASEKSPFGRKVAMLQDYQRVYGTLEVKARHCLVDRFKGLNDFMFGWRRKQKLFQDDPAKRNDIADARIQQLKDLGVEFPSTKWEGKFKELRKYKEVYGKVSTSHAHPLRSWCFCQRTQMRAYEEDPQSSSLMGEQYQKLVNLGMKSAKKAPMTDATKTGETATTGETTTTTAPATIAPMNPAPTTIVPATPAPVTTAPAATAPVTTAPATPAPATTVPAATASAATASAATASATPAPATPVPATTASATTVPATPSLTTTAPAATVPVTTAPATTAPTTAPAATASSSEEMLERMSNAESTSDQDDDSTKCNTIVV